MKKRNVALAVGGAVGGAIGAAVAVKLLTRPGTINFDDYAEQIAHADHSHFVNIDGARVHYQEFGDVTKPAMILIHGYTASAYVWKTSAPILADAGFRVIAIDLIGFGYSEKPSWFDYSIQSQSRMIQRFMNRLGIGRATLVGSSYGGAVSAMLALDYPEMVEKLVLVDAVTNNEPKDHPILKLASVKGVGEVITPFLCDSKSFMKFRMQGTLAKANHHMITRDRIESIVRPLSAADGHHSVLATSRNWNANRIEQDAHLINHQTLIIWGDSDTVIPIKNGYKLHEEILNSRFVILKDCGHVPQEECTYLFTSLVTEFCHDKNGRITVSGEDGARLQT